MGLRLSPGTSAQRAREYCPRPSSQNRRAWHDLTAAIHIFIACRMHIKEQQNTIKKRLKLHGNYTKTKRKRNEKYPQTITKL